MNFIYRRIAETQNYVSELLRFCGKKKNFILYILLKIPKKSESNRKCQSWGDMIYWATVYNTKNNSHMVN